ncbi:MAG: hypothetical protein ACI4QB_09875, partial [Eubacteriales bacterium]
LKCRLLPQSANRPSWAGGAGTTADIAAADAAAISPAETVETIDAMRAIAAAEIENARETIPLVEYDSRLGYEPSMEYMCDRAHLEWKIAMTERALGELVPLYEKAKAEVTP